MSEEVRVAVKRKKRSALVEEIIKGSEGKVSRRNLRRTSKKIRGRAESVDFSILLEKERERILILKRRLEMKE